MRFRGRSGVGFLFSESPIPLKGSDCLVSPSGREVNSAGCKKGFCWFWEGVFSSLFPDHFISVVCHIYEKCMAYSSTNRTVDILWARFEFYLPEK